jgi:hypothetical protein
MPDEQPTKLDKLKDLINKRKLIKQKLLDDRYADVTEYEESEEERTKRIWNNPDAWE